MPLNIKNPGIVAGGNLKLTGVGSNFNLKVNPPATPEVPVQWSDYMLAWYRSDNITVDSSHVVQMLDKSGNGRHLGIDGTPVTVAPLLVSGDADFNGHDSLSFNGTTQWLSGSIWNLGGATGVGYVICAAFKPLSYDGQDVFWDITGDLSTNPPGGNYAWLNENNLRFSGGSFINYSPNFVAGNKYYTTVSIATGSWEHTQVRVNGAFPSFYSDPNGYAYNPVDLGLSMPTSLSIARFAKPSGYPHPYWSSLKMTEMLIFSGTLPSAGKTSVEAYLSSRYSI
jgi:hypothetical protein